MPALNLLQILSVYAALLGLIFVALSVLTIRARRSAGIALGTGDDEALLRRMRAHANFAEYVPLALILIAGTVITGSQAWFVHACGGVLIAGRLFHARALFTAVIKFRVYGMVATFIVIIAASLRILGSLAPQL